MDFGQCYGCLFRIGAVIKLERGRVIWAAIQFAEAKFIAHLAPRTTAKRTL